MSRADRVAELIKKEVSDIIFKKMNDPRIGFTSVTAVDIGPDLQMANIYVSVFGDEDAKTSTMNALQHAKKFIRCELGNRIELRDVPDINFKRDDSIEKGARVFEIINKLHQEEGTRGARGARRVRGAGKGKCRK